MRGEGGGIRTYARCFPFLLPAREEVPDRLAILRRPSCGEGGGESDGRNSGSSVSDRTEEFGGFVLGLGLIVRSINIRASPGELVRRACSPVFDDGGGRVTSEPEALLLFADWTVVEVWEESIVTMGGTLGLFLDTSRGGKFGFATNFEDDATGCDGVTTRVGAGCRTGL